MIRYYKIVASNGYAGCTRTEYIEHDDEIDVDIEEIAWDIAVENGESYAHCAFGWGQVPPEDSEEYEAYIEGCDFSIIEVTKEEYDENV
ncbi:MAG: hypothetical protein NC218_07195 [Acetobacter sp.]|nr:hypothetical protein [Acetobacter sp.]